MNDIVRQWRTLVDTAAVLVVRVDVGTDIEREILRYCESVSSWPTRSAPLAGLHSFMGVAVRVWPHWPADLRHQIFRRLGAAVSARGGR